MTSVVTRASFRHMTKGLRIVEDHRPSHLAIIDVNDPTVADANAASASACRLLNPNDTRT